jgi:hypothetical protein
VSVATYNSERFFFMSIPSLSPVIDFRLAAPFDPLEPVHDRSEKFTSLVCGSLKPMRWIGFDHQRARAELTEQTRAYSPKIFFVAHALSSSEKHA